RRVWLQQAALRTALAVDRHVPSVPNSQPILVTVENDRLLQVRHGHVDLRIRAEHQGIRHQEYAVHRQRQAMAAYEIEPSRRADRYRLPELKLAAGAERYPIS